MTDTCPALRTLAELGSPGPRESLNKQQDGSHSSLVSLRTRGVGARGWTPWPAAHCPAVGILLAQHLTLAGPGETGGSVHSVPTKGERRSPLPARNAGLTERGCCPSQGARTPKGPCPTPEPGLAATEDGPSSRRPALGSREDRPLPPWPVCGPDLSRHSHGTRPGRLGLPGFLTQGDGPPPRHRTQYTLSILSPGPPSGLRN